MAIPSKVRISGYDYGVFVESGDDFTAYAEINHRKHRIRVADDISGNAAREALMHEVIHGIENAASFDFSEKEVNRLSRALYAVMRDNPDLVAYLMGEDEPTDGVS